MEINIDQLEKDVREFHNSVLALQNAIGKLNEFFHVENPMFNSAWKITENYCKELEAKHDLNGWLDHWWNESNFGRNERASLVIIRGEEFVVDSVDALIQAILKDKGLIKEK